MRSWIGRLLSLGITEVTPDLLARHLRVTNALALVGLALLTATTPVDWFGGPLTLVTIDCVGIVGFVLVFVFNARGFRTAGRALVVLNANFVLVAGTWGVGNDADVRSVFFPLTILPFLIFELSEVFWLILTIPLAIAEYFALMALPVVTPGVYSTFYTIYAPALSFTLIITGSIVFTYINRTAERNLVQARERATQSARLAALGEMSSGIAHEIRNPLAAIQLAAGEIVARTNDPAMVGSLGQRIERITMRASRIIEALRSFARDASNDPFVNTPLDRVVTDALELCAKRFTEHGVNLEVAPVPPDISLECRPVQLSQVLVNLLNNAYDAVMTLKERWIRVEVRASAQEVELVVTDSGPGIPEQVRARLFEPFFTTKGPDRGTGLGLSLSRGLIESHHGALELDTTSRHTRFVIVLPRAQPRASDARNT